MLEPDVNGAQGGTRLQHFRLLAAQIDPAPILDEIASLENPWDRSTGRQKKIQVQREARSIPIRGLRKSAIGNLERRDVHESRYTTTARLLPKTVRFLEEWALRLNGELSRAKLVCLPPGHRVHPHIDRGEYCAVRDRYHFVLQSQAGSWLKTADECVELQAGELWWFDNKLTHEAFNGGTGDRIHFIFDLKPISSEKARPHE